MAKHQHIMNNQITSSTLKVYISDIQDTLDGVRMLYLKLPHNRQLSFKAGQYITLSCEDHQPRPYSIANAPGSSTIEAHIRQTGLAGFSDFVCNTLKPGDQLYLNGPFGNATYKTPKEKPIFIIAGGTGISFAKSILEEAIKQKHNAPIYLFWGNESENGFYLDRHFQHLAQKTKNFHYIPTTKQLNKKIQTYVESAYESDVYLAGPELMITSCARVMLNKDVLLNDIITDLDLTHEL